MLCTDWLKFYYHYKGQCVGIRKLQLHKCSGGEVNRNPWLAKIAFWFLMYYFYQKFYCDKKIT